jgi:hypothetical protein
MRERQISEEDWDSIQGGKPNVSVENNLTIVTHDYLAGKDKVIRSHKSVEDYGTVRIFVNGRTVEFPTALMRRFHGDPCEIASIKIGGHGYDREAE